MNHIAPCLVPRARDRAVVLQPGCPWPSCLWFVAWATGGLAAVAATAGEPSGGYLGPSALAVSQDKNILYAACADARELLWVELPGGKIVRRASMPGAPAKIVVSPDGRRLYVACAAAQSVVAVVDALDGQLLATIPVGHTATALALDARRERLYVCNRFDNSLSVIDVPTHRELTRIPAVREPVAVAVAPDGQTILVANHLPLVRANTGLKDSVSATLTVVDADTWETATIKLHNGASSLQGLCISSDGRIALVTHVLSNFLDVPFRVETGWINANAVSIVDVRQRKLLRTIGLDEMDSGAANPWDVAFTSDGELVCVACAGTHELSVIGYETLLGEEAWRTMAPIPGAWPVYPSLGQSLWKRLKLPGKGPRAMALDGSTAYVAEYFTDSVAVVDLRSLGSIRTIELGPPPVLSPQRQGELLFHDATICYQQWQSCASCHPDARADALNWDLMNDGTGNPKNTKSMLFSHVTPPAMAESVRETAEDAVRSGLTHILFANRPEEEALAIDAYLKSLKPVPSPLLVGNQLSESARRGSQWFDQVGCQRCHPAPWYTDLRAHPIDRALADRPDRRLDTPTLLEVWRTAPYMHDGSYLTVRELLTEGQHGLGRSPKLTESQIDDLVAFVLSL
ncbi:MAG: cell surface protein [Planctomycetes bacterium]|nr:cell surface protein [Planctomycetota bacterium]